MPGRGLVVESEPVRREPPTVLAVLDRYIDQLTNVGPDTRSRYRRQAKVLDSMLNKPTAWDVTDEDVRKWVLTFGRPPYSKAPKTVSNYHGLLAAAMDWALGKGLVQVNPCLGTKLPRRDIWIDGEDESKALTPEEYALLWRGMHSDSRDFIDVAAGSGLRFGELTALCSSSTNVRWMGGRAINYVDFFESRWRPAVDAAVSMGLNRRPRFHNLRATSAVWLVSGGVDVVAVQELLGHDSLEVTRIYLDTTKKGMAQARAAIESALRVRQPGGVDGVDQSLTGSGG